MKQPKSNNSTHITIVAVLYNKQLEDSSTVRSLKRWLNKLTAPHNVIIYNNSPELTLCDPTFQIMNAEKNGFLAHAYNYALQQAEKNKSNWLLLLDDDTEITEDYFCQLNLFLNTTHNTPNIATVTPFLKQEKKQLSPHKISKYGWWNTFKVKPGLNPGHITAFNSLTLIKVEAIRKIGGFSEQYPLDMLDHWYYWKLDQAGYKTWVLNTQIQHNLSLTDYTNNISPNRHASILNAERLLTKEMGLQYYITCKIRLLFRLIKQIFSLRNCTFTKITLKTLFTR